jgi:hypothetical protein
MIYFLQQLWEGKYGDYLSDAVLSQVVQSLYNLLQAGGKVKH